MNNKWAINIIKDLSNRGYPTYKEAIQLAIKALEKQVPVEHHRTEVIQVDGEIRMSVCPSCLGTNYTHKDEFPKFCSWCGQAIDWSEE